MPRPKFPHIKTHSFRDRLFKILWKAPRRDKKCPPSQAYFGECDYHARVMQLYPTKSGLELLDTVLEEGIHASHFDLEDSAVRETVRDIRRLLVRMGIQVSFTGKPLKDEPEG
jgi:hypothetical protein